MPRAAGRTGCNLCRKVNKWIHSKALTGFRSWNCMGMLQGVCSALLPERGDQVGLLDNISFALTVLTFRLRDLFVPPAAVLENLGIKRGQIILDYGCGPGSYSAAAAGLVGPGGRVYAADMNKNAVAYVRKIMESRPNLSVIRTDCRTGLPDNSVDAVFLFDVYHNLKEPEKVLKELHRVLKDEGKLFFSDHHMGEQKIIHSITAPGSFKLSGKDRKIYRFAK